MYPLGAKLSSQDKRDIVFASVVMPVSLPAVFSLRSRQSPVVTQFYGSCVGYTGKDLKEAQANKDGKPATLSGRGIYILCKQNDGDPEQGTDPRNLMKVLRGIGAPFEADIADEPTDSYEDFLKGLSDIAIQNADANKISGFAVLLSIQEIKQAIQTYGELALTIQVYDDYLSIDGNGVIRQPTGSFVGLHEVLAIGWDDSKGLEIKNHWGTSWGQNGYAWLPYTYNGQNCFVQAYSTVDFIGPDMKGAPVNLQYPIVDPIITQSFGARPDYYKAYGLAGHEGLDFHATTGTNVFACDDGKVIFSGVDGAYGNCVKIQHSWGISLYGHLNDFVVTDGATPTVRKGQLIAHSDNTGDSEAPHLHFGIKINGVSNPPFKDWVDPKPYMGKDMNLPVYQQQGQPAIYALVGQYLVPFTDMGVLTDVFPGLNVITLTSDQFAKFTVVPALPTGKNVGIGIY